MDQKKDFNLLEKIGIFNLFKNFITSDNNLLPNFLDLLSAGSFFYATPFFCHLYYFIIHNFRVMWFLYQNLVRHPLFVFVYNFCFVSIFSFLIIFFWFYSFFIVDII